MIIIVYLSKINIKDKFKSREKSIVNGPGLFRGEEIVFVLSYSQ